MRLFWASVATVMVVRLAVGCNTFDPSECRPNTSGGFGGAEMIPIATVGASSGDFFSAPPKEPLDYSDLSNPCIMPFTACEQKCEDANNATGLECAKIADAEKRNACLENAYYVYKKCLEKCAASAAKTCLDMFEACKEKDHPCTREVEKGKTLCVQCQDDCLKNRPYKFKDCYKCGFDDP